MCPSVMFFLTNGNGKFVFISSVLFTEEGDENDTQRKKLKTDINERQLNYTSKMKQTRKIKEVQNLMLMNMCRLKLIQWTKFHPFILMFELAK